MPVLLLAQGEPAAKDMLRQAIEARYGMRPPALDSLRLDFKGRERVKVGPVSTWVPVDATAYFHFPKAMRWDFNVKPLKMSVQRGAEAYDGEVYRTTRGRKEPTVINDPEQVHSMRRRLWGVASILLTPLSDMFVNLTAVDSASFEATNTKLDDTARITLRADNKLNEVRVKCLNPDTNKEQDYVILLSEELVTINDLILPAKLTVQWDNDPSFELEPIAADINPQIPDAVFMLQDVE